MEFIIDSLSNNVITKQLFIDNLFEMVDYWIGCNHPSCYVAFLEKLYDLIALPKDTIRSRSSTLNKNDNIHPNCDASHNSKFTKSKIPVISKNLSNSKLELNLNVDLLPNEMSNIDSQNVFSPSKIPLSKVLQEMLISPTNLYKFHSSQTIDSNNSPSFKSINNNAILYPLDRNSSFSKLSSLPLPAAKKMVRSSSAILTHEESKDLFIETRVSSMKWKELNNVDSKSFVVCNSFYIFLIC